MGAAEDEEPPKTTGQPDARTDADSPQVAPVFPGEEGGCDAQIHGQTGPETRPTLRDLDRGSPM
jgi:hypothetical protein